MLTSARRIPRPTRATSAPQWQRILLSLGVAVLALAIKAPEFVLPMGPDQGIYNVLATELLSGQPLYVGAWDNQAPGVYLVHAALLSVLPGAWMGECLPPLGPVGCRQLGMQAFDLLYTLAIAATLFRVARAVGWQSATAWLAAALGAGFSGLSLLSREGSTPEKLALLPMTLAAAAYLEHRRAGRRFWLLCCGLLLGLASASRMTALVLVVAISVADLLDTRRRSTRPVAHLARTWAWLALGGILVWGPLVGYLATTGGLPVFVEATFGYNGARLALDAVGGRVDALSGLKDHLKVMLSGTALLWVAGGSGAVGLLATSRPAWRFVGLWVVASSALLLVVHEYVQLIPSLALAGAWALQLAWQRLGSSHVLAERLANRLLLTTLALVTLVATNEHQASVLLRAWYERVPPRFSTSPDEYLAGLVRREHKGSPIFIWGEAANVYVLSGASPASRFINLVPLARPVAGVDARRQQVLADLATRPPGLVLIQAPRGHRDSRDDALSDPETLPEFMRLVQECYEAAELPEYIPGWQLFRQKSGSVC